MPGALRKRAHRWCALFVCGLLAAAPLQAEPACTPLQADEYATVRYVHDGDTLHLSDGRKLRFIGINTPELAREERPQEPYAREAQRYVRQQLPAGSRIGLKFGAQRRDRHGRLLAHIILADGSSLNRRLLQQGYAQYIAMPPNLLQLSCYRQAETEARAGQKGLWRHAYHRPQTDGLQGFAGGFRLVRGRVVRLGESRHHIWLNLDTGLALRIARSDLNYFKDGELDALVDRTVEARGWLYRRKGQLRMSVHHPAALMVIEQ